MTPIYQYPAIGSGGAILEGAMTALGGGLAEIESAKKARDQMNSFSEILASRGLVGDAKIYKSMADAQTPNFLQAAISGQPTKRDTDNMAEHALKILSDDRALAVRAQNVRDSSFIPNTSILRKEIGAQNSEIARLNAENDKNEAVISNPNNDPSIIQSALTNRKRIQEDLANANSAKAKAQADVNNLIQENRRGRRTSSDGNDPVIANGPQTPLPTAGDSETQATPSSLLLPDMSKADRVNEPSVTEKPRPPLMSAMSEEASPLNDAVSNLRKKPTSSETVSTSGDPPEVAAAKDKLKADVDAARAAYTLPDKEITSRAELKNILTKAKLRTDAVLTFDNEDEAIQKAKTFNERFTAEKLPQVAIFDKAGDKYTVTFRAKTGSNKPSSNNGPAYIDPIDHSVYTVHRDGLIYVTKQDGTETAFKDKDNDNKNVSLARFESIMNTRKATDPAKQFIPVTGVLKAADVNNFATSPKNAWERYNLTPH